VSARKVAVKVLPLGFRVEEDRQHSGKMRDTIKKQHTARRDFRENASLYYSGGRISGVLRRALTPTSLGLAQHDRMIFASDTTEGTKRPTAQNKLFRAGVFEPSNKLLLNSIVFTSKILLGYGSTLDTVSV
jgi:hypothetical protein